MTSNEAKEFIQELTETTIEEVVPINLKSDKVVMVEVITGYAFWASEYERGSLESDRHFAGPESELYVFLLEHCMEYSCSVYIFNLN